jgi:two-component system, chemotaxis family, chemotaxis protein CheY
MSFNVLIVDDSHSMRAVIKKIITISGFKMDKCLEANDGVEALEVLGKNWVDIIISDINMPRLDGFQLLGTLKEDSLFRNIPVIIISTEGSSERIAEAFRYGAKGFIEKPFQPEDVRAILYEVVGMGEGGEHEEHERSDDGCDF